MFKWLILSEGMDRSGNGDRVEKVECIRLYIGTVEKV
jgi:hypothetical protein